MFTLQDLVDRFDRHSEEAWEALPEEEARVDAVLKAKLAANRNKRIKRWTTLLLVYLVVCFIGALIFGGAA